MMQELKPKTGIVGGRGKMGAWFAGFFRSAGLEVLIADRDTELSAPDLVRQCDIVVFSVPINSTAQIISDLIPYTRSDQMLMDLTSLKSPAVSAMLQSEAEVLGAHPMFGPRLSSISGQTVVVCRARERRYSGWMIELLRKNGAVIKESLPEAHDRMMSVIQGLNHFNAIVLGACLERLGVDLKESLEYSSPVYKLRLDMIGRIMAQNPDLYADIALQNPANREVLKVLMDCSSELMQIIESGDREGFVSYFRKASGHFGEFSEEAIRESNRAIEELTARTVRR